MRSQATERHHLEHLFIQMYGIKLLLNKLIQELKILQNGSNDRLTSANCRLVLVGIFSKRWSFVVASIIAIIAQFLNFWLRIVVVVAVVILPAISSWSAFKIWNHLMDLKIHTPLLHFSSFKSSGKILWMVALMRYLLSI